MVAEVPPADATNNDKQEGGSAQNAPAPEEKKEDDKRMSTANATASASSSAQIRSPKKASTPTDSILPVNMPNSMMSPTSNRPPSRSSMSVQSAGSGGGRTTTSRRGGRTRSRSPTAGHNISSGLPPYGGRPSSTTPSIPSEIAHHSSVTSPRNPSAAAAAAAAAAKSFRNPNAAMRGPGGPSSSMHYPPHQQPPTPYGSSSGRPPSSMRDPYGRQGPPPGRQDPYSSSRYPGGPPPGQRPSHQRTPSSASTSYPGSQPPQRPHSRSSVSSYPGGPPPGYYDPHNGSRNPSSSSHHQYRGQHSSSGSRSGPPPGRYDPQAPANGVGPDGRPLSRNAGPSDPQNPYGYNPYHRNSGGPPPSSRGGMPPGGGRDYGSQYPGRTGGSSSTGRYSGPPGGGPPGSGGPVDNGEYGRQPSSSSSSSRHGHTPPPHHRHQYSSGGPPPPSGHHPPPSSSTRGGPPQAYPGSSSSSHPHTSYRHGDPNARGGPPPPHYRGGPPPHSSHPPQHSSRAGPPPGHPDYHRYHSQQPQQQQLKQHKGGGDSMMKSTRSVMGGATPLHLNKGGPMTSAPPGGPPGPKPHGYGGSGSGSNKINDSGTNMNSRREPMPQSSRRGSAASVFRGRPGPPGGSPPPGSGGHRHPGGAAPSSNNPKSILDSLDTPSNSFDEKKASRIEGNSQQVKSSQDQLSPEDPPKLRNSGNGASGSGSGNADLAFDPQPSPKSQGPTLTSASGGLTMSPPQLTNSLDMAPSFSLFNQSFDSLGDTAQFFNVGGALDTAMLNSSTSFELKTSGSRSPSAADHGLQLTSSNGTFKLNASMSGFGMSPTNSFGGGPTASFSTNTPGGTGGSVTILGGNSEHGRSSSPSQVLDMYKSAGSIEEGDLRLSVSLCSPMIGASASYSSSRPFATGVEGGPPQPTLSGADFKSSGSGVSNRRSHLSPRPQRRYSGQHSSSSHYRPQRSSSFGPPNKNGSPRFYNFLRRNRGAFLDMTFLLPELKIAVNDLRNSTKDADKRIKAEGSEGINTTPKRGQTSRDRRGRYEPTDSESAIARRRIVSAVCAFGGTFVGSRQHNPPPSEAPDTASTSSNTGVSKANSQSIFREKKSEPATVTPNSSGSSSIPADGDGSKMNSERANYDGALPTRYYESDNRLSWEFEENPPIGPTKGDNPLNLGWCQDINEDDEEKPTKKRKTGGKGQAGVSDEDNDDDENDKEGEGGNSSKKSKDGKGESPKMRYRCKLCGQPKTNHVCPYQQSLVRNIGLMVHPAVNAFTAAEPGQLAPALTEMNNMAISAAAVQAEKAASENSSPTRPTPDRSSRIGPIEGGVVTTAAQVTPESLRSGGPSRNHGELMTPGGRSSVGTPSSSSRSRRGGRSGNSSASSSSSKKKRSHAKMSENAGDQTDLLFVEEMETRPEQFRTITPSKAVDENPDAFTYPALPLPYAQRKRLSDNLFSLSKEIPQLTDECAAVLREARERDLWDLAVAELMTQVVVVVHCHQDDTCFEGLRRYLLTLGFTC